MIKEEFIEPYFYFKWKERLQINNLSSQFKKLEKEEQKKTKTKTQKTPKKAGGKK